MSVSGSLISCLSSPLPELLEMVNSHFQDISFVGSSVSMCCWQNLSESVHTGVDPGSSATFYQRFGKLPDLMEQGVEMGKQHVFQGKMKVKATAFSF